MIDPTTGQQVTLMPTPYRGPVQGLQQQYFYTGANGINVTVTDDNWFIYSAANNSALTAHGGTNVLDADGGSSFMTGGSGTDTFFLDEPITSHDVWSTVVNFHAGDAVTAWGLTPSLFTVAFFDNQGAPGFTGLTMHAAGNNQPNVSVTLPGYSTSDLSNGRLATIFGNDPASGSPYFYIHALA